MCGSLSVWPDGKSRRQRDSWKMFCLRYLRESVPHGSSGNPRRRLKNIEVHTVPESKTFTGESVLRGFLSYRKLRLLYDKNPPGRPLRRRILQSRNSLLSYKNFSMISANPLWSQSFSVIKSAASLHSFVALAMAAPTWAVCSMGISFCWSPAATVFSRGICR